MEEKDPNSPEFEFWRVRNPSAPQHSDLHSADELFSGGILLPLHLLHHRENVTIKEPEEAPPPPPPPPQPKSDRSEQDPGCGPDLSATLKNSSASSFTSSKRWKDIILKRSGRNASSSINGEEEKDKMKKKEKKKTTKNTANVAGSVGSSGVTATELNINIWPFRRSRSAGTGGTRPRMAGPASRKVSSAPCSRSNSAGESKSRKWPSSPTGGGVHLGRSSPVWQLPRAASRGRSFGATVKSAEKGVQNGKEEATPPPVDAAPGGGGGKSRVLNLSVPVCVGYRHHLNCTSGDNSSVGVSGTGAAAVSGGRSGGAALADGVRGSNLFNIRSLFTKKVC